MKNTLLVVIDMQNTIVKMAKNAQPHSGSDVLANNEKLIQAANDANIPVAIVTVTKKYLPKALQEKMLTLALSQSLLTTPNISYYTKYEPSACSIPELREVIKSQKIETVILTGLVTNNGVYKTYLDLTEQTSVKVIPVEDAMSARSEKLHTEAINQMANLTTTTAMIQEIKK
ncbi:cysteine hydrolase family protein [Lactococcus insecticola]|uniref:Isochorismatase-like domain-containing protein n=1 Tax=Pseudolactococcus insecticola TaxID=2709158 RepID=A0A6A0B623_9LACT|nr:isochorismatase family cysteine hydrolase [Lactococcus insecticola]GFH39991.1 hypothetical protein Hs20B_03890 [Lactococcus insecticola]